MEWNDQSQVSVDADGGSVLGEMTKNTMLNAEQEGS
jgi:hypothetical protein